MREKAIHKYNSVRVLTPMVYALNLSGCRLLTFAYIQGFCNDEVSSCYSSTKTMSEILGYAQRTIKEALTNLSKDGFIYKVGTMTIDGQKVNGYRTYFFELMDRYDAGEEIKPSLLSLRRGASKQGSAQCAPVNSEGIFGAQCAPEVVHNVHESGEQCAPNSNKNLIDESKESLSESARAREAEEREFFKIFFMNNAADPAAEVKRFVGYYQSKGWQDTSGRRYDTPDKRAGLAYGWDCKSGERLSRGESTDKFYKFLGSLYDIAGERGGIDPRLLLDVRGGYRFHDGQLIWDCIPTVQQWFESLGGDTCRSVLFKHFGVGCKLFYGKAS